MVHVGAFFAGIEIAAVTSQPNHTLADRLSADVASETWVLSLLCHQFMIFGALELLLLVLLLDIGQVCTYFGDVGNVWWVHGESGLLDLLVNHLLYVLSAVQLLQCLDIGFELQMFENKIVLLFVELSLKLLLLKSLLQFLYSLLESLLVGDLCSLQLYPKLLHFFAQHDNKHQLSLRIYNYLVVC